MNGIKESEIRIHTAQWVEEYGRRGGVLHVDGGNLAAVTNAMASGDFNRARQAAA